MERKKMRELTMFEIEQVSGGWDVSSSGAFLDAFGIGFGIGWTVVRAYFGKG